MKAHLARAALVAAAVVPTGAHADSTSGVDVALFRLSYDTGGIFALEGARLMPRRDLSFKLATSYAQSPIDLAVPGIGGMANTAADPILDYLVAIDMTFGMSITKRLGIGLDVGAYRTAIARGYGVRGRYAGGQVAQPSTGLISLRPLSNIDPSADPSDDSAYLGDGLAGPLDTRVGLKYALVAGDHVALAAIGTVALPFGDDHMLLGDRDLVYEPNLAAEYRFDRLGQTRVLANVGARIRRRTVLEAYDTADPMATDADAKVFLDVGSELIAGLGGTYEVTPRVIAAGEAQLLVPLPASVGYGRCRRHNGLACRSIDSDDYWADAGRGDLTALATLGVLLRVSADVAANLMLGTGQLGARGDDVRITTGLVWSPQPAGAAAPGRNDRDGDGIADGLDGCPDETEDKDGFQDEDGCADADNDRDAIADADDACPLEPEDKDGHQDADGCPERDNDADGVPDAADKCPNEPEDVDGFEDDDGCPDDDNDGDGEERADRIDLKGQPVAFDRANKLTPAARALLGQAATIIKNRKLTIRVEVHVALGTKSQNAATIRAQRQRDKQLAQQRARAIQEYLVSQGVPAAQLQAVGIGSDRPLGTAAPTDPINDRVDLIKAQQAGPP